MNVVPALLLFSLALVVGSIVLFVWSARQGDCHEADRLCLLPLEDDTGPPARSSPALPTAPCPPSPPPVPSPSAPLPS